LVARGLVAGDVGQERREDPDRSLSARSLQRPINQAAAGIGLTKPHWAEDDPCEQVGVFPELVGLVEDSDCAADRGRTGFALAVGHERHAVCHRGEERRAPRVLSGGERHRALGGRDHRRCVAGVEAAVYGLGEHHDGELRIGGGDLFCR
jgi:hypothetical protein